MRNEAGLIPTGTRIVVRPQKMDPTTASGLVLVERTVEIEELAATRGVLIDAGEEAMKVKEMRGIKIGDLIFFAKYAGSVVSFSRKDVSYRVMDGSDVLGKVEAEFDCRFQAARTPMEAGGVEQTV